MPDCKRIEIDEPLMQPETGRSSGGTLSVAHIIGGVVAACSLVAVLVVLGMYFTRKSLVVMA